MCVCDTVFIRRSTNCILHNIYLREKHPLLAICATSVVEVNIYLLHSHQINAIFVVEACKPTLWFDRPSFLNVAALMFVTQGYLAVIKFVRNPCMVLDRKLKKQVPTGIYGLKEFCRTWQLPRRTSEWIIHL